MDPIEKRELKRKAWMRLAAQRRRAGLLRGRVVVLSLLCFAVLWGAVFIQMITGNDPVLAAKRTTTASRTVASAKDPVAKAKRHQLEQHLKQHEAEAAEAQAEAEAEAEIEGPVRSEAGEAELAEAEAREAEAAEIEAAQAEALEIEAREIEAAELAEFEEPLVTSQS